MKLSLFIVICSIFFALAQSPMQVKPDIHTEKIEYKHGKAFR